MTTPTPKLALATAADWSWLDSAVRMAWLCWQNGSPQSGRPATVLAGSGHADSGHATSGHADSRHADSGHADSGHADSGRANSGRAGSSQLVRRVVTGTPAPAAYSIGPARTFVLHTMHDWGEAGRAGDVAAVVSELLANALRHALPAACALGELPPAPIRLGLQHAGPYVVCAVADPSSEPPVLRQPDWQDESGRGLVLVSSLSDRWGHCLASGTAGKVVWAAFASDPA